MDPHLPNAKEIRLKLALAARRKKRDEKDERMLARWILFCKGSGSAKNLSQKDKEFLIRVKRRSYDEYVADLNMDKHGRRGGAKKTLRFTRYTPGNPPSFNTYVRIWYGGAKANYIRYDVPKIMQMRMEALRNADGDTEMCKLNGRWLRELQRQIDERERGKLGVPVRELQVHPGSVEGRSEEPKHVRSRRKETPAGNRDAAAVGT